MAEGVAKRLLKLVLEWITPRAVHRAKATMDAQVQEARDVHPDEDSRTLRELRDEGKLHRHDEVE